jgi:Mg2+ and Co2+ transporter CorA
VSDIPVVDQYSINVDQLAQEFSMSRYASRESRNSAMLEELAKLRDENAELRRLIRDVTIPAFTRIEYGAGGCYSEWAAKAKAQLQEAVK